MNAEIFFKRSDVVALIEQARIASSMPIAVHEHGDDSNEHLIAGAGGCSACRYAASTDEGRAACAASRISASNQSITQRRTVPFVCHLGLSCVSVPFNADNGEQVSLTFGPFCPSEAPGGLAEIVAQGLEQVGVSETPELNDIARVAADGVPVLADWTVDRLTALWNETATEVEEPVEELTDDETDSTLRPLKSRARIPGPAPIILIALAAGDRDAARWFLRNALDEAATTPGSGAHARAVAVVSQVLEGAGQAKLPTELAWPRFEELAAAGGRSWDIAKLSRLSMRVLTTLRYTRESRTTDRIATVFGDVLEQYADGFPLEEAAARVNADPTAITHLLQRRFNLSYSELIGKVRVERAKRYLRDSQLTIGEIARRLGVADASNFGRLFRRYEGIGPARYRERYRQAA